MGDCKFCPNVVFFVQRVMPRDQSCTLSTSAVSAGVSGRRMAHSGIGHSRTKGDRL